MPLFAEWCEFDSTISDKKRLLKLREKAGGRDAIANALALVMRSHYDDVSRIAQDVSDLGYGKASALLAERMPRSATARSGELGEILATELVEEELGYWVPIRRLRYKDGREMALRGDDFIGIQNNSDEAIKYAKGESKSRKTLAQDAINDARLVLARDHGRPTPTSILFVADRLMDLGGEEEKLGRAIRNEVATRAVAPERIEHILFAVSGNATPKALLDDFTATSGDRPHAVIHLEVPDHQDFIKASFEKALKLGND